MPKSVKPTPEVLEKLRKAMMEGKSDKEIMEEIFASDGRKGRQPLVDRETLQTYVNKAVPVLLAKGKKVNKANTVARYAWWLLITEKFGGDIDAKVPGTSQISQYIKRGELQVNLPDGVPVVFEYDKKDQENVEAGESSLDVENDVETVPAELVSTAVVTEESPSGQAIEPPTVLETVSEGIRATKVVPPPAPAKKSTKKHSKVHA